VQVEQKVPPSEDIIDVSGISPNSGEVNTVDFTISVFGDDIKPGATVSLKQGKNFQPLSSTTPNPDFISAQRIDVDVDLTGPTGLYDVTVTNPSGDTFTLPGAFQVTDPGGGVTFRRTPPPGGGGVAKGAPPTKPTGPKPKAASPPVPAVPGLSDDEKKELEKHPLWDKIKHLF
jgi:hypothetical protein